MTTLEPFRTMAVVMTTMEDRVEHQEDGLEKTTSKVEVLNDDDAKSQRIRGRRREPLGLCIT